jgi:hypothetical protein
MALGSTQPVTEMSTRSHIAGKVRLARESDILTAICEPIFLKKWGEVRMISLRTSANIWPIVPAPDDDDEYGAVSGMIIGRGNRSTRRKPAPVSLCPPQIPLDHTRARTRAPAMGSRRHPLELWRGLTPVGLYTYGTR